VEKPRNLKTKKIREAIERRLTKEGKKFLMEVVGPALEPARSSHKSTKIPYRK